MKPRKSRPHGVAVLQNKNWSATISKPAFSKVRRVAKLMVAFRKTDTKARRKEKHHGSETADGHQVGKRTGRLQILVQYARSNMINDHHTDRYATQEIQLFDRSASRLTAIGCTPARAHRDNITRVGIAVHQELR